MITRKVGNYETEITEKSPRKMQVDHQRRRGYVLVSTGLIAWTFTCLYFVLALYPTAIYFLSYYAVDYRFGFVRRGLGGELIRFFPGDKYFFVIYAAMWAPIALWLIVLAILVWRILSTGARSERRIMLAILTPLLPFTFSFSVFAPRPEVFGMTALLAFSMLLRRTHTSHSVIILSSLYGFLGALLALIHEAIPLEFAFGAVLAVMGLFAVEGVEPENEPAGLE